MTASMSHFWFAHLPPFRPFPSFLTVLTFFLTFFTFFLTPAPRRLHRRLRQMLQQRARGEQTKIRRRPEQSQQTNPTRPMEHRTSNRQRVVLSNQEHHHLPSRNPPSSILRRRTIRCHELRWNWYGYWTRIDAWF